MAHFSHYQYKFLLKKLLQPWVEIKVLTFHKLIEIIPHQVHAVIQVKGSLLVFGTPILARVRKHMLRYQ